MATKTINLTGAEVAVTGLDGAHAHIRNDGTEVIYAAKTAGITAGADGVASIPAGQSDTIRGISGAVYLLGTGSVLVHSDDYVVSPFKTSAQAGGSGADEVARAAINTHSGNAEIHVTAEEKAAWNGKAEQSDFADHVGNLSVHMTDFEREKISEVDTKVGTNIFYAQISGIKLDIDELGGELHNHAENAEIHVTAEEKAAWDGKAELSDIPQKLQYVNYLGYVSDIDNILNNTNYSGSAYECVITTSEAAQMGLPSCWWQIKYFRHTDNNGFGIQIAFPIDGPSYLPRYRTSIGTVWNEWKLFSDGGNAATLETHPASDFVLKSDYDALEARVAALEGGTT